jgi:hypothetical protein
MYRHDFNGILWTLHLAEKTTLTVSKILDIGLIAS